MKALGMIEVRGFLGAVSAADAALKAADVELNNAEVIRGGLTTVELVGDVAAVEAAVDAGVVVAEALDCLIAHHVIARVDPQTQLVTTAKNKRQSAEIPETVVAVPAAAIHPETQTATIQESPTADQTAEMRTQLLKEKVVNLRKRAYKMELEHLKKSEIKFANKQTLVDAIMAEIERSDHDWN